MSDPQLAIRRLAQAIQIIAHRTAGVIGTNDAGNVIGLCAEAVEAMNEDEGVSS